MTTPVTEHIDALLADFLADELAASPVLATQLGADSHDAELPDLTAAGFAQREAAEDRWTERFGAVPDDALSLDQRIDLELVRSALRGRQALRTWASWRRNPDTYLGPGLGGVFLLFLHRLRPEPDLVADAESRLRGIPALLDAGRENLDPDLASPVLIRRALGQARAGVAYARDLVPAEVADPALRARLAAAGELASAAFESFANWLEDFATRATGDYALGEVLYSTLLREREGLGYGARELRERGQKEYDALADEMVRRTREIAGHGDWRALMDELNSDHPTTSEEMRAGYADWTDRARAFCRERGLVSFPDDERCLVEPSPHFQRPVLAVASYMTPPAFKPGRTGYFFVPYPPEGTSEAEAQERLATNSFSTMPTIAVHEAYPGHHWHLTWIKDNPRAVRKLLPSSYFIEGWGLYSERLMVEQGFYDDPRHELCAVDARLFRAARIVVDTSLHLGEMTVDEAVTFMSTKASLTEPTARAEVARYCSWPTQAASYLTGSLEIERIRERWVAESRGTLREFHDRIAGSGMLPLALAELATLGV